jgi:serine/threonine-protein kinase
MSSAEFDPTAIPEGTQVGPYRVVGRVGEGGMGTVYRCERDGQEVAIKFPRQRRSDLTESQRADLETRMLREVSALTAVHDRNVVRVLGFDRYPDLHGYLYLVMELVRGERLYVWVERRRPSLRAIIQVLIRIANALDGLHAQGVLHRDIKSENILIREDGEPVLIDFGVSRHSSVGALTVSGAMVGTPTHMSPEQCRYILSGKGSGDERYAFTPSDDLYAVGFVLHELLAGGPPFAFQDGNEWTLAQEIAGKVPEPVRQINPAVPESLEAIVTCLLAKEPARRFRSGKDLAAALQRALEGTEPGWDAPYVSPPRDGAAAAPLKPPPPPADVDDLLLKPPAKPGPTRQDRPPPADGGARTPEGAPAQAPFRPPTSPPRYRPVEGEEAPAAATPARTDGMGLPTAIRVARQQLAAKPAQRGRGVAVAGVGAVVLVALGWAVLAGHGERPAAPPKPENLLSIGATQEPTRLPLAVAPVASEPVTTPRPAAAEPSREPPRPVGARTVGKPKVSHAPALVDARQETAARRPYIGTTVLRGAAADTRDGGLPAILGVPRGQLIAAKLTVPADPMAPGPVTAVVTQDLVLGGAVAVPRGATLVGTSGSGSGPRLAIAWDTLTIAGRAIRLEASTFGADRRPGLALRTDAHGGESPSPGQDVAIDTAGRLAARVLGDDAIGDVGRGALEAATRSVRSSSPGEVAAPAVASAGTPFFVFVQQPF